jgi:hypothetical protein
VVQALVADETIDDNRWIVDGECQCLIPSGEGPFRIGLRTAAGIDRLNPAATDPHTTACIEFGREAGLWTMVVFSTDEARQRWQRRVASAFRLLADSGFGGERTRGWGRSEDPRWKWSPELSFEIPPETPVGYWLLSLYAPAASDTVDWKTGNYTTATRTGRAESATNWGALKSPTVMISEGSVIVAAGPPCGEARDVAPPDFPHPVYRSGFAVAIPVPWRAPGTPRPEPRPKPQPVSEPVVVTTEPAPTPEPSPLETQPDAAPATEPEPQLPASAAEPEAATPTTPELEARAEPEWNAATPSPEPDAPAPPEPEPEPVAQVSSPVSSGDVEPETSTKPAAESEPEAAPQQETQVGTPVPPEAEPDSPQPTIHNPQPADPGVDQ